LEVFEPGGPHFRWRFSTIRLVAFYHVDALSYSSENPAYLTILELIFLFRQLSCSMGGAPDAACTSVGAPEVIATPSSQTWVTTPLRTNHDSKEQQKGKQARLSVCRIYPAAVRTLRAGCILHDLGKDLPDPSSSPRRNVVRVPLLYFLRNCRN
jgi:hypothetical protein